ncbi:MAG: hypothetical protein GXP25_01480 [Planctomycetes bacterium]|nr:hypothetical protein [Planctomycetota bacterium]
MDTSQKRKPKIGLLPLYLKLYDDTNPGLRARFVAFMNTVADGFTSRRIDVARTDVCRVASEFADAVACFEREGVDCIVTLHLAYSPSLESIDALTKTELPILILDTTMDAAFGPGAYPDRIMYNHGIHGVMDMASVLRRRGRSFQIMAGHVADDDFFARAVLLIRAASAANQLRDTKALRVGEPFKGMGDFFVEQEVLKSVLGITVEQIAAADLIQAVEAVTDKEVEEEVALDRERFTCAVPEKVHARSVRVGLGLRRRLGAGGFHAFSMNFLAFDQADGPINTVPFIEASKAMARGLGYAGEGDVLTAALVGALSGAFGKTTFTEIFCPDWNGNSLFLSHMGEINPDVANETPRIIEKPFPYTPAQNPAVIACAPKAGPAVFVDLVPGPDDTFSLIVAPVEMLGDATNEKMKEAIRGWMRPACGVRKFLETYSRHGGTHHSALVMDGDPEAVCAFGELAGIPVVRI